MPEARLPALSDVGTSGLLNTARLIRRGDEPERSRNDLELERGLSHRPAVGAQGHRRGGAAHGATSTAVDAAGGPETTLARKARGELGALGEGLRGNDDETELVVGLVGLGREPQAAGVLAVCDDEPAGLDAPLCIFVRADAQAIRGYAAHAAKPRDDIGQASPAALRALVDLLVDRDAESARRRVGEDRKSVV